VNSPSTIRRVATFVLDLMGTVAIGLLFGGILFLAIWAILGK